MTPSSPAHRLKHSARRHDPERLGEILDRLHLAAVEAACNRDRSYSVAHPAARSYLRRPVTHEFCLPGGPCLDLAGYLVRVVLLAPGLRLRHPEDAA